MEVNIRVTDPVLISLGPGVYTVLVISKLPSPLVVQSTKESFVDVPLIEYMLPAHMVASFPAKAVGLLFIVTFSV